MTRSVSNRTDSTPDPARSFADWLETQGLAREADAVRAMAARSPLGASVELAGPVGERNVYSLRPRRAIAALAETTSGAALQLGAILAAGSTAVVAEGGPAAALAARLPQALAARVVTAHAPALAPEIGLILFEGGGDPLLALLAEVAERAGPIVLVEALSPGEIAAGAVYDVERLLAERTVSTNTAAAGGDAALMAIG